MTLSHRQTRSLAQHSIDPALSVFLIAAVSVLFSAAVHAASLATPTLPEGFESRVWAPSHLLANPVAMSFGPDQRLYVAEAHRKTTGVWGVTFSRWWAMEDYQSHTLADRQAMYARWSHVVPPAKLTLISDRVRVVFDSDRDGTADASKVFAGGFNDPLSGNAAGVLALDDSVLFANVPSLWKLRDTDKDNEAEQREELHRGFGVRVGVHGHDLHGLIQGPDGKVYFTIGDRGYDVTLADGSRSHGSHHGAVFRCKPDGSDLELFHTGLRNPQELAFNDYGDLFTVDNNMSGGDECRILHLLEGADSGWDATYQLSGHFRDETARPHHPQPPWFTERLWATPHAGQPHWHHPAVGNLSRGPSGLAHYPGTGLPPEYNKAFFLADFVGSASNSGILAFWLNPAGATYQLERSSEFAWGLLVTDIEFGPDGALYAADWITGWTGIGEGTIRRIHHPEHTSAGPLAMLAIPAHTQSLATLENALSHPDRRVRSYAQFELAKRGTAGLNTFSRTIRQSTHLLAKLHAVWGIGQITGNQISSHEVPEAIKLALTAPEAELRAQAARFLGDSPVAASATQFVLELMTDPSPRVRYHATMAAAKHNAPQGISRSLQNLTNGDFADPALRHAIVTYLEQTQIPDKLAEYSHHPRPEVRHAAALALQRHSSPRILSFLNDDVAEIQYDVIRAVHDGPIAEGIDAIADLIEGGLLLQPETPFPIAQRVINANFRLGKEVHAIRLAQLAANPSIAPRVRLVAANALDHWRTPSPFDRVTWNLRPHLTDREHDIQKPIRQSILDAFLELRGLVRNKPSADETKLFQAIAQVMIKHHLTPVEAAQDAVVDTQIPSPIRLAFLRALISQDSLADKIAITLLNESAPEIRALAAAELARQNEEAGWNTLTAGLRADDVSRQQASIRQLGTLAHQRAISILKDALARGEEQPEAIRLDLYQAAASHADLNKTRESFLSALEASPLKKYSLAIDGGSVEQGEHLFKTHVAQCFRCHLVDGYGGTAGPELTTIGKQLSRSELVEALVWPNRRLAEGYGSTTLDLENGDVLTGVITQESETQVTVRLPDSSTMAIPRNSIHDQSNTQSAMPPMGEVLTLGELRDLVAFLASLK